MMGIATLHPSYELQNSDTGVMDSGLDASRRLGMTALIVMQHHPADRGEADDDGNRDRPGRNPDIAGGLPFGLVLGDLAVARLVLVRVFHRPPLPFQRRRPAGATRIDSTLHAG